MLIHRLRLLGGVTTLCLVAACGDDDNAGAATRAPLDAVEDGATDPGDAAGAADASSDDAGFDLPDEVTFHEHVRPLVEAHCASCHTSGGIGPMAFDDPDVVLSLGAALVDAVDARRMPPWMPAKDCHPYADDGSLPPEARAMFLGWRDGGFVEGDPGSYSPPTRSPGQQLPDPDLELTWSEPYAPNPLRQDDYRCLPLDVTFDEDTWVTGTHVAPDQTALVHHVLLYMIEPDAVGAIRRRDEAEAGPGYTCFGTPGNRSTLLGVWAPGNPPNLWPEGSALQIPAGALLVPQVHYSLATAGDGPIPADQTRVQLWTRDGGDPPDDIVQLVQILDSSFTIPAGAPAHTTEASFPSPIRGDIVGVFAHMHLLGTEISIELDRAGSDPDACLVDIPRWDFDWQLLYRFPDDAAEPIEVGDQVRLRCQWDNSAANQPVIDGARIEPRDVGWGDGTLDEMCYGVLAVRRPRTADSGTCGGFEACYADCDDGDGQCLLGCIYVPGQPCAQCMTGAIGDCLPEHCPVDGLALLQCLDDCGDTQTCLLDGCEAEFDAAAACMAPHIRSGACDEAFAPCDVAFAAE